jgi:hypothetical protein
VPGEHQDHEQEAKYVSFDSYFGHVGVEDVSEFQLLVNDVGRIGDGAAFTDADLGLHTDCADHGGALSLYD